MPPAPGGKASVHHLNDLSHYTHCLACLPAVGINMTILWTQHPGRWKRTGLKETGHIKIKMMFLGLHVLLANWGDRWKWGAAGLWKLHLNLLTEIWLCTYSWMMNRLVQSKNRPMQDYCRKRRADAKSTNTSYILCRAEGDLEQDCLNLHYNLFYHIWFKLFSVRD